MTKAELIKLLEPFADDQGVSVRIRTARWPMGAQLFIQGVSEYQPLKAPMIGINCDIYNNEIRDAWDTDGRSVLE